MIPGILCGTALLCAWVSLFADHLADSVKNAAVALSFTAIVGWLGVLFAGSLSPLRLVFLGSAGIVLMCAKVLLHLPSLRISLLSGLFAFYAAPATVQLTAIGRSMWGNPVCPGMVSASHDMRLVGVHLVLIVMCATVAAVLLYRKARGKSPSPISLLFASGFAVFAALAFARTVPRGGGDLGQGLIWLLFLVPAFGLSCLGLMVSVSVVFIDRRGTVSGRSGEDAQPPDQEYLPEDAQNSHP